MVGQAGPSFVMSPILPLCKSVLHCTTDQTRQSLGCHHHFFLHGGFTLVGLQLHAFKGRGAGAPGLQPLQQLRQQSKHFAIVV
jgi:hypothetical protein